MSMEAENPRAVAGGNNPPLAQSIAVESGDFALVTTAYLQEAHASRPQIAAALLEEARALPAEIADDDDKSKYTSLIKRIRDETKALDALHGKEKTPYLRGGQAVDQFFFGIIDRLMRRDKKGKPGGGDILMQRLNAYDTRKLAEEQARREAEWRESERKRLAAEAAERQKAFEAEQARLAAERARAPAKVEEKASIADTKEQEAVAASVEAKVATAAADDARYATLAKPAEIMRSRGSDGTLSTMATEKFAEIVDESKLDKDKLWPFIKLEAKEAALRAYAANTGYTAQMAGASIGKRPKSKVL